MLGDFVALVAMFDTPTLSRPVSHCLSPQKLSLLSQWGRERERERERDRQTDRHTDRQTDRQTETETKTKIPPKRRRRRTISTKAD